VALTAVQSLDMGNSQSAAAKQDHPVLLICTVGGSPQPIATALRVLRPDVAWFLVSDGKTGESSRSMVEEKEIDYDKKRGTRGPGLKYAEGCPSTTRIFEMPVDDPDRAYALSRSHVAAARKDYPEHRVIADYTGGSKSMSAALLMAAFAETGVEIETAVEVQFMAGERSNLVQVTSGSEKPQRMTPYFIMAERDFVAAEQAVGAYDYAAAQRLLDKLQEDIRRRVVTPPKAWSRRLQRARAWTGVMAQWDAFNHRQAAQRARAEPSVEAALEASGHRGQLLALGEREKGKPGWEICADLWLNALRRGERARYDDAVARLYRLLEAAAQARLWEKSNHRLETGRIDPAELPESMRSSVFMKLDPKDGTEFAQLGLNDTVRLLRHRDPNDALAAAYASNAAGEDGLHGPPWLVKRNNSILAHGFVSIDNRAWDEAKRWVETNLMPFLGDVQFRQLPREIPLLQDIAV
jgi:CRISPR-associated protein (TIGR02710 family)